MEFAVSKKIKILKEEKPKILGNLKLNKSKEIRNRFKQKTSSEGHKGLTTRSMSCYIQIAAKKDERL